MQRLTDEQAGRLHEATLEVLQNTGLRILEPEACAILARGGCAVEGGSRVRFPPHLIEWARSACPNHIVLHDQAGRPALHLSGTRAYFGNGSDLLFAIDHRTGRRRRALLSDMREMVAVMDSLEYMDFVMSGFLPSDEEVGRVETTQMAAMLEGTNKPIVYVTTSAAGTRQCIELAAAKAGGEQALRERPFAVNYINISNPLRHNPESVRKLMWLARRGLPSIYRPSIVTRGISTPTTPAGFLVVNNAAFLAGLVLSQLIREGAPFIRCGCSGGTFDMRTMVGLHAAPEVRGLNEALAEWYGIPRFGIGGLTGSKLVDAQAALESALTLFASVAAGAQLIHDVGYMDNGTTGSLVQLVMCHEMIGWLKQYERRVEINDETLALDVIARVVDEDGDFLQTDHTLRHFREDHYPLLLDRDTHAGWTASGGHGLEERARERVDEILAMERTHCTDEPLRRELERIQARFCERTR